MRPPSQPVGAIVVDFDGTVVDEDVSEEILRAFAPREWWDIDLEFQRAEIGSRECLMRQAALLHGTQEDMLAYAVSHHRLDPTFGPFVSWAHGSGITVAVASDGFGFYVEAMLRAGRVDGVAVHTNRVSIRVGRRPAFEFPEGHPVCPTCVTC